MRKRTNKQQVEAVLKELRAAGLEIAATNVKPSEIPYYSSVSSAQKKVLVVK